MQKNTAPLPDWELVLFSAARLQRILPDAVLVGGTASAIHAAHRFSRDADHVLADLRNRFDEVLAELESVAGWKTARVQRPVQILGSLDGIETGVRQLIRDEPLETVVVDYHGARITVPTEGEILRIKGVLILKRNATRDYLDFVALADHMGDERVARRCSHSIGSTRRTAANHRYNNCKSSLPMRCPTTWKKPNSATTRTSTLAGTSGKPFKRLARTCLP